MDAVITYVDGNDPFWKADYQKYTNVPIMDKRFRDWGTLKYLLRGIHKYMPFVDNVYLVVSHPSQVPSWADQENLHIVLHKDIIPAEFLPTFNSNPIEMHLHRIEGLSEEYLYFNDDLFPVAECLAEDFFRNGKGVLGFKKHWLACGMYKKICRNSDRVAREAAGLKPSCSFLRPQHICTAMLKSQCEAIYAAQKPQILASLTRTRTERNLTQYLFLNYQYYKGLMIPERISSKHCSLAVTSPEKLKECILNPQRSMLCINDVRLSDERFEILREAIVSAFETRFPDKSRFEK